MVCGSSFGRNFNRRLNQAFDVAVQAKRVKLRLTLRSVRPWKPREIKMGTAAEKTILVVDDSEQDVEILLRSFKAVRVQNPIQVVAKGEHAIYYLAGEGHFSDRGKFPMTSVVLLDLKMPGTTGFDVLRWGPRLNSATWS
jgi:hypothetical protein